MTKRQIPPATGSANRFSFGHQILAEEIEEVLLTLNYVSGYYPQQHISLNTGFAGQHGSGSLRTHSFSAVGATYVEWMDTDIYVHPHAQSGTLAVVSVCDTGTILNFKMEFTGSSGLILSSSITGSHDDGNNWNQSKIHFKYSGTCPQGEFVRCRLYLARTGTVGLARVKTVRLYDQPIIYGTHELVDPQND